MGRFTCVICAVILIGCGRADNQPAENTSATGSAATESQGTLSLTDVAGRWRLRMTDESGGNVVETELTAAADTSGWTWRRPDGTDVPVRVVAIAGDSITLEAGPFESALRPGVSVQSVMVFRLQADRLMGHADARYLLSRGDSVARRPAQGTRVP